MAESTVAYFNTQSRLTTWTDELEYLGYILCEMIAPESLNNIGYGCHQAADLPTIIDILRVQSKRTDGTLSEMMREEDLVNFRRLLTRVKKIRNLMAHHGAPNEDNLNRLKNAKERLSDILEYAIRAVASDRGIYEVSWSPSYHAYKTYLEVEEPPIVMVPLNQEPLLSFRARFIHDRGNTQNRITFQRPKRRPTDESRQKHREAFETAVKRKMERKDRDFALRSKARSEKLYKIEQRFIKSQELGYNRLNKVKTWMKDERELFQRQQAIILENEPPYHGVDENQWLILFLLALCAPMWLVVVFIRKIHGKTYGSSLET